MNRKARILIIISIIAIILGGGLFVIGFAMNDWNFKGLDKTNYVTNTYELEEDFVNFDINVDTADIELIKSNENIDEEKKNIILEGINNMRNSEELKDIDLSVLYVNAKRMNFKYLSSNEINKLFQTQYQNMHILNPY